MKKFKDDEQEFKYCSGCGIIYPYPELMFFKHKSTSDGYDSRCKECVMAYGKKYNQSKSGKARAKRYRQSEKGKKANKRFQRSEKGLALGRRKANKYRHSRRGRATIAKYELSEIGKKRHSKYFKSNKGKKAIKKYQQSEKGKEVGKRINAKRREMEFIPLFDNCFSPEIEVDWHHLNDVIVIAIPRVIHRKYYGKNHRERLKPIVEEYYEISYVTI